VLSQGTTARRGTLVHKVAPNVRAK